MRGKAEKCWRRHTPSHIVVNAARSAFASLPPAKDKSASDAHTALKRIVPFNFCAAMLTFALHVASGSAYYFRFMYSFSDL